MKLIRVLAAAATMLLSGCAIFAETYAIQQVDNWVALNEPLAQSGKIKWSQFYSDYLERVSKTPVIGQGPVVETLGILMTTALFYEGGRLSRSDLETIQGIVRRYQTIDDAAANVLAREALVKALQKDPSSPARLSDADRR